MKKFVIVSDDICTIKQIVNNINKINASSSILIYDTRDFKRMVDSGDVDSNIIYFLDICNMEDCFIELLRKLRNHDMVSKIVIITINNLVVNLMGTSFFIFAYIEKCCDFDKKLKDILSRLLINSGCKVEDNNVKVTDLDIPVILDRNQIDEAYLLPNSLLSIYYNSGRNNIVVSLKKTTKEIRNITGNNFYVDKGNFKVSKKKAFSEPLKQLLVDLYLIFKVDCDTLERHFQVDARYIRRWASLKKYNRKLNFWEVIMGKIVLGFYFKNDKR